MKSKAHSLLKKLRAKKHEEEGERPKSVEKRTEDIKNLQLGAVTDAKSGKVTYIDPLDFFKTEHPIEVDTKLDEFGLNDVEDESKKEEKKENEPEKKVGMKGLMGAIGVKIKFDEMMKARAKIKKDDKNQPKKSLSVGSRNVKNAEKNKFEMINKSKDDRDQRLFIKLTLALNKYKNSNSNQQDIYQEILKKISELKGYKDETGELEKELNEIIDSLKIKNIVLCPDAQQVSDEDVTDSIGKQISLEQIMSQMNLKSDA